jgi:glycosyltransferase involved in cell wall biosynthesis
MISVVIPALNEEASVEAVVGRVRALIESQGWHGGEIVVVDDGSTDRTAELARAAGARIVSHPSNAGYGRSLKDGILAATNDLVAITDADGTYPVERIPELVALIEKGFDMAVGARQGPAYRESAIKHPLRIVLRAIVEYTAGQRIPDPNSGLRVFRRSTIVPYFPTLSNAFSFTTSSTLAYMLSGRFVAYLPIDYAERIGTTKVRLFRDSLRTMQYIVQAILYHNPLKLFLLVTLAALLASGVCLLAGIATGAAMPYLFALGGFVAAVNVAMAGLIADLIRQNRVMASDTNDLKPPAL